MSLKVKANFFVKYFEMLLNRFLKFIIIYIGTQLFYYEKILPYLRIFFWVKSNLRSMS